jgi:glutaredoxin-related protein
MKFDDLQQVIDDHQVVVVGTAFSDTRRIEQVVAGQFDDVSILRLNLQHPDDLSALEQLQRNSGWKSLPMVFINGDMVGGEWELTSQQQLGINTCGRSTHGLANIIGYCGLIPFLGLSIWYAMTEDVQQADFILSALVAYGAIILGFVGAIHWGRSLHEPHMVRSNLLQIITVIPTLIGWIALVLPATTGLSVLIAAFIVIYLFDRLQYRELYWMQQLRFNLSLGVVFSLLLSLLASQKF